MATNSWVNVALLLTTVLVDVTGSALPDGVKEYCQFDSFKADCIGDKVIVVKHAQYGRMRSGGCIRGEGYVGCQTDAKGYMDSVCSGRHTCEVKVASLADYVQPCRKDFTSYLEASYECVQVAMGEGEVCTGGGGHVPLTSPHGFLSSLVAMDHGYGLASCPWVIDVPPGQTIKLVLSVFGTYHRPDSMEDDSETKEGVCPWQIVIEENEHFTQRELCEYQSWDRTLYKSTSNRIKIYFIPDRTRDDPPAFILKYEAEGCADLKVPREAVVTRKGDDLAVYCNNTKETWYLTCKNNKWMGGKLDNCTEGLLSPVKTIQARIPIPFPQGLIIAVILGILLGVIIGTSSLGVLYIIRRRRFRQAAGSHPEDPRQRLGPGDMGSLHDSSSVYKHSSGYGTKSGSNTPGSKDTTYMSRVLPQHPPEYTGPGVHGPGYSTRRSHVYETPRLPGETEEGPIKVYYELDPEQQPRSKST